MFVVTIGRADLMDEWSRHRTMGAARKEAKKMARVGHRRAGGTPQVASIWREEDWDSDGNRKVEPSEVWEAIG